MAPIGKLYGAGPEAAKMWRTFAAAKYAGVEIEHVLTAPRQDSHKPEFKAKFPLGKVPAFEGADGFCLTESRAIARYVAGMSKNTPLLGTDEKSAALIDAWVQFADDELFSKVIALVIPVRGFLPYSKPVEQMAWDGLHTALSYLESHLQKNTFLVGHRVTLADLVVAGNLRQVYTIAAGEAIQKKYPNTIRFMNTVINQPTVADIAPQPQLLKEDIKYVAPKKEEKPKAAAAPAAAAAAGGSSKKKAKKADDDDDDDESLVPAEPKAKNPLDDLPKSSFNLEEWKRVYSNQDTRKEALPWFFKNFDSEGFSVWRFDFKYNEELTQIFMSANQIGGFFNRLEASRKYVMGTAGVFGKANDSAISGVVICRGKDYAPVLGVAPDIESYEVKPLDLSKDDDKKFFEDMMAWEATLNGKEWADGKILK